MAELKLLCCSKACRVCLIRANLFFFLLVLWPKLFALTLYSTFSFCYIFTELFHADHFNHFNSDYLLIQIFLRHGQISSCLQPTEPPAINNCTVKTRPLTFITDLTNRLRCVCEYVCAFLTPCTFAHCLRRKHMVIISPASGGDTSKFTKGAKY